MHKMPKRLITNDNKEKPNNMPELQCCNFNKYYAPYLAAVKASACPSVLPETLLHTIYPF